MAELTEYSTLQIIQALRTGQFSSREITKSYLERIRITDPSIHAYLNITEDLALSQADEADKQLSTWRKAPTGEISPLLGVPVAVKDVLCVKGVRCTCGSRILEDFVPPYNATVVERLIDAGMVILGKTNTDEFTMGSSTENSAFRTTHNPWELERVPGGSSGGSAAAVAANMAPLALGTDTGGSVRQPASFCGLTGIKPTYGRVSRYGLVAYGSSLDVVGAISRQAVDLAFIFSLIAGIDPLDATTSDLPAPEFNLDTLFDTKDQHNIFLLNSADASLNGLRIGVPDEYFLEGIQPQVESAVKDALHRLEELGAELIPVSLPHTEYALPVYYLIAPAEASANLARYDGIRYGPRIAAESLLDIYRRTRGEKFGAEVKRRVMLGTYALSAGYYDRYYGQAQKVRTLIRADFEQVFKRIDVIAAPVTPTTAFSIGEHTDDPLSMYLEDIFTLPANLAGIPGIAFPVGFDQQGLPIGMQLMGPHFQEQVLFQTTFVYQQATNWHEYRPPITHNRNQKLDA
ncbi:MAG: Asp-tRNA(Asn)/Glu-tRNA(Gln) amidotransferase subunit GatA [Chloroflexota bacterium]|nr:Asp-tRNA(Asn)/Glu-tRNA(Gln) amidotransferase subunit GatA [Chloroflexota bacterium]